MAITPSSPITGGAQTGFTSPTYTVVADAAPGLYGRQWYVSALGGTQTGASVHTVSSPFTISVFRPARVAPVPTANPITGIIASVPKNQYKAIIRKGCMVAANNSPQIAQIEVLMKIPAGAETYNPNEIRAMFSAAIGFLNQQSAALGDAVQTGAMI